MSELVIYLPDGTPVTREVIDKADLFDFCCAMVSTGPVYDWWEQYPSEHLPNGGRQPENKQEAMTFMRHTRGLAIEIGLWRAL